jgi:hypothetical protein
MLFVGQAFQPDAVRRVRLESLTYGAGLSRQGDLSPYFCRAAAAF